MPHREGKDTMPEEITIQSESAQGYALGDPVHFQLQAKVYNGHYCTVIPAGADTKDVLNAFMDEHGQEHRLYHSAEATFYGAATMDVPTLIVFTECDYNGNPGFFRRDCEAVHPGHVEIGNGRKRKQATEHRPGDPNVPANFLPAVPGGRFELDSKTILEEFRASLGQDLPSYLSRRNRRRAPLPMNAIAILFWLRGVYQDSMGTIETYAGVLCQFLNYLQREIPYLGEPKDFDKVTRHHVQAFVDHLKAGKYAPRTIRTKLFTIRSFYRYFLEESEGTWLGDVLHENPAARVRPPKDRDLSGHVLKALPLVEVDKLLAHVRNHGSVRDFVMLRMMFDGGLRVSEAVAMRWGDLVYLNSVKYKGWYFKFRGKGSKQRLVPLNQRMTKALFVYRYRIYGAKPTDRAPGLDDLPLFPNSSDWTRPLSRSAVAKIFEKWGKAALGYKIHPHQARHSAGTNLSMLGASIDDIQDLMGHSDIRTTQVYENSRAFKGNPSTDVFDQTDVDGREAADLDSINPIDPDPFEPAPDDEIVW